MEKNKWIRFFASRTGIGVLTDGGLESAIIAAVPPNRKRTVTVESMRLSSSVKRLDLYCIHLFIFELLI